MQRKRLVDDILSSAPEMEEDIVIPSKKRFVIVTQYFSGLGFAKMLKEEGHDYILATIMKEDEEKKKEFNLVGNGYINKAPYSDALAKEWSGAYFIFDQNHNEDIAEALRLSGEKVFGATRLKVKLEKDRKFAADLAKQAGLSLPETQEFHSAEEGIAFLEENEDRAFVFKPNNSECSHLTYVPNSEKDEDANMELKRRLKTLTEGTDDYILQERRKGIEANFEMWVYEGKPFFAFANLENKRKLNRDEGEHVGCAQDIGFCISLESKAIQKTLMGYLKLPEFSHYTGFLDVNVIIADRENYFLENCGRFGYNAHPNIFQALAIDGFGDTMADFMDGNIKNFYDKFRGGFGASVSLYIDHPQQGLPIMIKEDAMKNFYPYDIYEDKDGLYLAAYDNQVGVFTKYDTTIEDAGEGIINSIFVEDDIVYPDRALRTDIYKSDYPSAPIKRYRALEVIKYI
ncbi:MAG: hypothetical protein KGI08_00245 [Thaumarchaeota archaeon]|nr:hypothetical protein [Nitrososphaerota archaeon]